MARRCRTASDERELISIPPIGEDDRDQPTPGAARAGLAHRAGPHRRDARTDPRPHPASGFCPIVGKRVVLTGGASQLTGLPEAARRILARNVRIGRPMGVSGLPTAAKGPAFSTAVGLMIYPQVADMETHAAQRQSALVARRRQQPHCPRRAVAEREFLSAGPGSRRSGIGGDISELAGVAMRP